MREILFRAKTRGNSPDISRDGEWVEGFYIQDLWDGKVEDCIFNCPTALKIDPVTLGQFTGLTDCAGRKIFEGDIIHNRIDLCQPNWAVEWKQRENGFNTVEWGIHKCEIIGNIFDNPELMEPIK